MTGWDSSSFVLIIIQKENISNLETQGDKKMVKLYSKAAQGHVPWS